VITKDSTTPQMHHYGLPREIFISENKWQWQSTNRCCD